jgi:arginine-tRNA-protein transferase
LEENLSYHKIGFSSSKMRYDDYEALLNAGFTRCGSYFYIRKITTSCCEAYQYRVDLDTFIPSRSQKKALARFHKYLNTGVKPRKQGSKIEKRSSESSRDEEEEDKDVEMQDVEGNHVRKFVGVDTRLQEHLQF